MSKVTMLLGVGVGYVLGARAGRERYEEIQQQARRVWNDPRVQKKKAEARDAAREQGEQLKEKAASSTPGSTPGSTSGSSSGSTQVSGEAPSTGARRG